MLNEHIDARNEFHAIYLNLKPFMEEEFPMLFSKAVPLIKEFRWAEFLAEKIRKRKKLCNGQIVEQFHIGAFMRCWLARREMHQAISNNEFRIDDAGYPIQRITSEERMHHLTRYNQICQKQRIEG